MIQPHQGMDVNLELAIMPNWDKTDPVLQFSANVIAYVSDSQQQLPVHAVVRGNIRRPIKFGERELVFDELSKIPDKELGISSQTLDFTAFDSVSGVTAEVHPPKSASAQAILLSPNSGKLTVTPAPNLPDGPYAFRVDVIATTKFGEILPAAHLPVRGICRRDLCAIPPAVTFGVCKLGGVVETSLVIQSRKRRPFSIDSVSGYSTDLQVEAVDLADVDGKCFRVRQLIDSTGGVQREIAFDVISTDTRSHQRLSVPVSYVGVSGDEQHDL